MTPEEQVKQLEVLLTAMSKGTSRLSASFSDLAEKYQSGVIDYKKFKEGINQLSTDLKTKTNPGFGQFALNIANGNKQFRSMQAELLELTQVIEDTADVNAKAILEKKRDDLARKESNNRAIHETAQFTLGMGKALVGGVATAVGGLARDLQGGASSTKITSSLMNAGIDMATAAGQATGGLIAGVGQATQALGQFAKKGRGPIALIGIGMELLGKGTTAVSEQVGKLAKFGVEILSAEVEKTVTAFNTMSSSGAIFANGMQGMRDASLDAGLTLDQFSRVVQANSKNLAMSGLGVAAGAAAVGRVGKIFDQNGGKIRTELRNLGFGIEEQAELTAQTIANMRRTAGGPVTDTAVAEQTQKYAENLRIIAGITGEDAKAKEKQVASQNQILAFQQYLAGKTPEQRNAINAAMSLMTEQEQKNLRDRAIFNGQVINTEGAIYESMNAAAAEKGRVIAGQLENNSMTARSVAETNAEYGESIKEVGLANKEFAMAAHLAGGVLGSVAAAQLDSINQANVQTKEAIDAIVASVGKVKETTEPLTKNMTDAANAAQALLLDMQAIMDGPIKGFSAISKTMLETVQQMISDLKIGRDGSVGGTAATQPNGTSFTDRLNAGLESGMVGSGVGGAVGAVAGMGVGSAITMPIGIAAGAVSGAVYGIFKPEFEQLGRTLSGWFSSKEGKARGGIATGPNSGYLEKLHGTEAVIPTVGGKVPIDLNMTSSPGMDLSKSAVVDSMVAALSDALKTSYTNTSVFKSAEAPGGLMIEMVAQAAQKSNEIAASFLNQGKEAILALASPITDSFNKMGSNPSSRQADISAAISLMTEQERANFSELLAKSNADNIAYTKGALESAVNAVSIDNISASERDQDRRMTHEFQQTMILMMQQFVQEQQTMTTKLDDQIRQTEKLVVAAT